MNIDTKPMDEFLFVEHGAIIVRFYSITKRQRKKSRTFRFVSNQLKKKKINLKVFTLVKFEHIRSFSFLIDINRGRRIIEHLLLWLVCDVDTTLWTVSVEILDHVITRRHLLKAWLMNTASHEQFRWSKSFPFYLITVWRCVEEIRTIFVQNENDSSIRKKKTKTKKILNVVLRRKSFRLVRLSSFHFQLEGRRNRYVNLNGCRVD